jgi:NtrC-family two-component system response regulator AlgB
MLAYDWPGNIRELQNVVERASILARGETVAADDLGMGGRDDDDSAGGGRLRAGDEVTVDELERAHIESILAGASSLEAAARTLGIDSSTLYRKRKRYGL